MMCQRIQTETPSLVRISRDERACRFYIGGKNIGLVDLADIGNLQSLLLARYSMDKAGEREVPMTEEQMKEIELYFPPKFYVAD